LSSRSRQQRKKRRTTQYLIAASAGLLLVFVTVYFLSSGGQHGTTTKPIILYVNQGNGIVNGSNFGSMVSYASSRGFNTVFFQAYRQGVLLFNPSQLSVFVNESHSAGLRIFFALYITNESQPLSASIYGLGEDGISLDMSLISSSAQQILLASLQASYHGQTAVTTTDMNSQLKPNLLVLETYGTGLQQYIRRSTIASVGVFTTSSTQEYQSQFQYALQNSDGAMVFDYAGLLKHGY
jgi:hypothetical protein